VDRAPSETGGEIDLGGHRLGHPERLDRAAHAETLVETEHLARYRWAAGLAQGRRVLDAGCGTAYGTEILARAGAVEAVGVDRAGDILDAVRERMPETASLQAADLLELPFDDGSFDLVVCFEVLEHLEDPEAAIAELARVLAPDGVLAVSSPNRERFPPGNPHHLHEYVPAELRDSLARRFANVQLLRQHAWIASAVLDDETIAGRGEKPLEADVTKAGAIAPDEETFTLALASDGELPAPGRAVVLGPGVDQRAMAEASAFAASQAQVMAEQGRRIEELEAVRAGLAAAEQRLAELPSLYASRAELDAIKGSPSWRWTAPLRRLKAPVRRSYPPARRRAKGLLAKLLARIERSGDEGR
jgi:SAM-dependent methyltransferase